MRRSRKPLSVVRRIEGSNPSPSASQAGLSGIARESGSAEIGLETPKIVEMLAHPQQDEGRVEPCLVAANDGLAADGGASPLPATKGLPPQLIRRRR
jgi:hypothetical protein